MCVKLEILHTDSWENVFNDWNLRKCTGSRQAILTIVISLYTHIVLGNCFSFGAGKELKILKEKKSTYLQFFLYTRNSHFVFHRVIFLAPSSKN